MKRLDFDDLIQLEAAKRDLYFRKQRSWRSWAVQVSLFNFGEKKVLVKTECRKCGKSIAKRNSSGLCRDCWVKWLNKNKKREVNV
jgi:hypothetical protein